MVAECPLLFPCHVRFVSYVPILRTGCVRPAAITIIVRHLRAPFPRDDMGFRGGAVEKGPPFCFVAHFLAAKRIMGVKHGAAFLPPRLRAHTFPLSCLFQD